MKFIIYFLLMGLVPGQLLMVPEEFADDGITQLVFQYKPPLPEFKLLVSEYIKAGEFEEARSLSLVEDLQPTLTSYSGFLTVDEDCGSNMFYWFFPSKNNWKNDPVSLWLDDSNGFSTFCGLLFQNGPYALDMNGTLELRNNSWNSNSSVIYIDNPVGTGFSYTEKEECYSTDDFQVGQNLFEALRQFFLLFPELQENPFYIFGESYGGKSAIALAHKIHNSGNLNINLKGFAIGNGWIDPINQMDLSALFFQLGLIDPNYKEYLEKQEEMVRNLIEAGKYLEANRLRDRIYGDEFEAASGYDTFHNFMEIKVEPGLNFDEFVNSTATRKALHVGDATWHGSYNETVQDYLEADLMKSMRPWLEELIEHYRVVLYNGQLDLLYPYVLTINYVWKMKWSGAGEYKTAQRSRWYVGEELAGYAKTVKNFTEILIRNAGNLPAMEQPKRMFDLYNRVVQNRPF